MSRSTVDPHPQPVRRAGARTLGALGAAAVLLLSGCAAGQISQTAQQVAAVDGGNATVGQIGVRNVLLATPDAANYGAGSTVPMTMVISNTSIQADTLTAVSTPLAGSVTIGGGGRITLPPQQNVTVGLTGDSTVALQKISRTLCFGQSVPVTFTFEKAGQLTVRVPIANPVERTGSRPTLEIQPPHETPLWETGEAHSEGDGEAAGSGEAAPSSAAEGSTAASSQPAASGTQSLVPATAGDPTGCNGAD